MNTLIKSGIVALAVVASGAGLWHLWGADRASASPVPAAVAPMAAAPVDIPPALFPRAVRFLNLTSDQRAQLAKIRQGHQAAVAAIRADGSLTVDERREKIRAEAHAALAEAGTLLTPDQRARLRRIQRFVVRTGWRAFAEQMELRHERQFWGRMGGAGFAPGLRPLGPPAGGRPGWGPGAAAGWGRPPWAGSGNLMPGRRLSPDQRAKIAALTQTYREQVRGVLAAP